MPIKHYFKVLPLLLLVICFPSIACKLSDNPSSESDIAQLKENLVARFEAGLEVSEVLSCLSSKDPVIRDQITYTALSEYLRGEKSNSENALKLHLALIKELTKQGIANQAIAKDKGQMTPWQFSFYILALTETTRVDRVSPYLTEQQRQELVALTHQLFQQINDYTGFTNEIGWVHQVAHSSDLVLQLALNPLIKTEQLKQLGQALTYQIDANGEHSYIHGESNRFARALTYLILRTEIDVVDWQTFVGELAVAPDALESWPVAYQTETGLAILHNRQLFLSRLLAWTSGSSNERLVAIQKPLTDALQRVN